MINPSGREQYIERWEKKYAVNNEHLAMSAKRHLAPL